MVAIPESSSPVLNCAGRELSLLHPQVMGVINTTPDSFSDGGSLYSPAGLDLEQALTRARLMCEQGATILDIGGESTRPGAEPVTLQQELDRVVPLVERIAAELDVVISVDTSSPQVMTAAASMGAGLINDVRALQREGALAAAATSGLPVCLMHMQGEPEDMQRNPQYSDVVTDVCGFLERRMEACEAAGIPRKRLLLDPGYGFGKSLQHNLQLLQGLPRVCALGQPVLAGLSRKSLIARLIERPVDERMPASLALAVLAVERGAWIIRAHDVRETADALAMCAALADIGA